MTEKKHTVDLSEEERTELELFVSSGVHRAEDITRARVLLKADDGATDREISHALDCSEMTPYRARKRYADRGIAAVESISHETVRQVLKKTNSSLTDQNNG
jgi:hypothetical protein